MMELGLFLAAVVAFGIAERAYRDGRQGRHLRAWREAAEAAGLERAAWRTTSWSSPVLVGHHGSQCVRFEAYEASRYETGMRITVEGSSGLTLRRETLRTATDKALGARELEIGDDTFDREVYVGGPPEVLRALLDGETRRAVRDLLSGRIRLQGSDRSLPAVVSVRDGDLQADLGADWKPALEELGGLLGTLLAVARRLEAPADAVERLAETAGAETEWRARLQDVRLLSFHPRHPAARQALTRACRDTHVDVRLEAALALPGELGQATLLEIATHPEGDPLQASRAVAALGRALPLDRALAVLAESLQARRLPLARVCLEVLGYLGDPAALTSLARVAAWETGDLAVTAARALGASGLAEAEGPLVKALHSDDGAVRVAAAEALGRVGSLSAVVPLKEAAARHQWDVGVDRQTLPAAARQAIAEIQSRVPLTLRGAAGRLSLAEGDAGQLSLAAPEAAGQED